MKTRVTFDNFWHGYVGAAATFGVHILGVLALFSFLQAIIYQLVSPILSTDPESSHFFELVTKISLGALIGLAGFVVLILMPLFAWFYAKDCAGDDADSAPSAREVGRAILKRNMRSDDPPFRQ